jgi:hypothetical protein
MRKNVCFFYIGLLIMGIFIFYSCPLPPEKIEITPNLKAPIPTPAPCTTPASWGYYQPSDVKSYTWAIDYYDQYVLAGNDRDCVFLLDTTSPNSVIPYHYCIDLPEDAAIDGIEVKIEHATWNGNAGYYQTISVELMWNGRANTTTTGYTDTANSSYEGWNNTFKNVVLGGANDKWGRTWSANDFSNENFGVKISCDDANPTDETSIDFCWVKVYYH